MRRLAGARRSTPTLDRMSVAALGREFASDLHRRLLKPAGFRKNGATFFRHRQSYIEMYNIQGSSWNSGVEPWLFYLNVGVQLEGVPIPGGSTAMLATHADGRNNSILPDTPSSFDLYAPSMPALSQQIFEIIERCSETLPTLLGPVLSRAQAGYRSPLPVPSTWEHHAAV